MVVNVFRGLVELHQNLGAKVILALTKENVVKLGAGISAALGTTILRQAINMS